VFSTNSTGNREIYTVNFSAEGDKIIFGDYSGKIYIQEWQNNTSAVILSGHSENFKGRGTVVYSAKEFPGGKYIASCGVDYTVRIWDLSTQSELNKFEGHIFHNRSISISADGKRVLSGSLDSTIRQWDIERGREIDVAVNHNGQVLRVDYSPTADSMVSCGRDSSIKLWKNYENVDEGDTISRILKLRRYLRIPDITAYIGEQVGVPIEYVDDDKYEPELQSRVFDAEIYVEVPNMLLNTVQPSDYIKSGTRKDTVIVKANGISFVDDTLAELISIALLGDVNREEIRIVDFKILNDSLFTI
jgi:WD40 repeat protein